MVNEKGEPEGEELQRFMEAGPLTRTGNPLHRWKSNAAAFPRLAAVEKKVLCVCKGVLLQLSVRSLQVA